MLDKLLRLSLRMYLRIARVHPTLLYIPLSIVSRIPGDLTKLSTVYSWPTYTKFEPIATNTNALKGAVHGLFTGRFIEILIPIEPEILGLKVSNFEELEKEYREYMRGLFNELEGKNNLNDKIELLKNKIKRSDIATVFIEEYIHSHILDKTSMKLLLEVISWKERVLEMAIAELIHSALGDQFPRNIDEKWPQGLNHEEAMKLAENNRENIRKLLVETPIEPLFREWVATLALLVNAFSYIFVALVEAPTWAIMEKHELMDEEGIYGRLDDINYFPDNDRGNAARGLAENLLDKLRGKDVNEIVDISRKILNPPIDDLVKIANKGFNGLIEGFSERIEKLSRGERVGVHTVSDLRAWDLFRAIRFNGIDDVTRIFSQILGEEGGEVFDFLSQQAVKPYKGFGVAMKFKLGNEVRSIIYDPWTMDEATGIYKVKSKRTNRTIGTLEDLVGSTPRTLRGYIVVMEILHSEEGLSCDDILNYVMSGRQFNEVFKNKFCDFIKGVKQFKYRSIEGFRYEGDESVKDVIVDILLGWIYMNAILGGYSGYLVGLHGLTSP